MVSAAMLLATGCAAKQVYEATQSLRVHDCEKLAVSERDACLKQARAPYSEHMQRAQE